METFDYKPGMREWYDKDLPESIRQGQRLTTMTSGQTRFPIAPSKFDFAQHGQSGAWISELLPYTAKMADDIAIVRSMHTEAINHEPAITFIQTGNQIAGKPCIGSWIAYGLGSMNRDLPSFVVMNATHSHPKANVQAISARLWSAGFLSAKYSGVALRAGADPVLYINNPDGVPQHIRRTMLDGLAELNQIQHETHRRSRNVGPHRAVRDGVPDAVLGAGADGHNQGAGLGLRTVWRRGAQTRNGGAQLPDGAAHDGARRALCADLPARLGRAQQPARRAAEHVQGR